jgi:rubrerythrin
MNVKDVLFLAYKMEKQGMEFYGDQKGKVKLPLLKDLFGHLEKMEQGHALYLEKQIENLNASLPLDVLPEEGGESKFRAKMEKQKIKPSSLNADLGDYSIMRMAYLIEKDFAEFYLKSAESNEGEVNSLLLSLADWEKEHASMIKNEMEKIISRNALDLGFYPL